MASELQFFRFLSTLPSHERNLYIWLDYYRQCLAHGDNLAISKQSELYSILDNIFMPEINKLAKHTHATKTAPRTDSRLIGIDTEIDEKLGDWASSFSDTDESLEEEEAPLPPARGSSLSTQ